MALIKWRKDIRYEPFFGLLNFQKDMDRLFNLSLFDDVAKNAGIFKNAFTPGLDLYEDKDNLVVKADLPGLKQEEIEVDVVDDILTIKGEKKQDVEKKEKNYYRFERAYGSFSRSIALPKYVDATKTKASYKDGVLELVIPKTEEAKKRKVKIEINK
ncbi:MAG: Hsp20/alpha crystallin family protein [Candidatus Omnitrophica bacterium]|nr:Hsp20/alpha crystallin family protein [Candidatus Omnitrophota bacterium]